MRAAERSHDNNAAFISAIGDTAAKQADAAMRDLVLINSGASISILTFVGQFAARANEPAGRGERDDIASSYQKQDRRISGARQPRGSPPR